MLLAEALEDVDLVKDGLVPVSVPALATDIQTNIQTNRQTDE